MKLTLILIIFLLLNNCSLNKDSKYWTEDVEKRDENKKQLSEILKKSEDITTMTLKEYEIYIDDYTKKSKYPNISQ
jgi:cell division protein FtsI/penicillin-binding protein 2